MPSYFKHKENYYQSEELDDKVVADLSNTQYVYPKQIKLLSNEKLMMWLKEYVLALIITWTHMVNEDDKVNDDCIEHADNLDTDTFEEVEVDIR